MEALAKQSGSIINAVMLGAIAGCGRLPIAVEQLEAAIREDGKAVEGNLRGFRAGLAAARAKVQPAKPPEKKNTAPATLDVLEQNVAQIFPPWRSRSCCEGVRRLAAYQDIRYARLYLDRLTPLLAADSASGAQGKLRQGSRAPSRRAHVL